MSGIQMKFFAIVFVFIAYSDCYQDIDTNGYILYCPCMGRFGNQAEQLLGALQFAKSLDRTLVIPPFIEYLESHVNFIPFPSVMNLSRVNEFHKVVAMLEFMEEIAPIVWKPENRPVFCYSSRPGKVLSDCNPCEGNPFESFWKQFNISSFSFSVFYGPLSTDLRSSNDWKMHYSNYSVLTFVGAPSSFPVNENAVPIQEYMAFADQVVEASTEYKRERNLDQPYIGVHLRWGSDWQKTCNLLVENSMERLFSSSQCNRDSMSYLPFQLCIQDIGLVTKTIGRALSSRNISTVFIASDIDDKRSWQSVYDTLKTTNPHITLHTPTRVYGNQKTYNKPTHFLTDLFVLSTSDIFVGNCISSFSAFVSRMRIYSLKLSKKKSTFFGVEYLNEKGHDEL